ncbi:unnamed protein product [Rotaria sordida]|uniref:MCM C-terminal AAA(+) ATPase domain-containing protein n=1 Tax=Rotaria sordida TaxID=392033 RepID=A0A815DCZ5_9BILA|nr:unnamed protein product [Rotaria sordida]CAF1299961.1 unnamed protein product [Rotaria sordida]
MEQQTLSISKIGIICKLNTRTSILAAANPIDSQWNKSKTIIENIQLSPTLLSRFDLIFLLLDPQNEIYDRRLAQHLASWYQYEKGNENAHEAMDIDLLRDYISHARTFVNPQLTELAGKLLVSSYVEIRKVGNSKEQISACPRQLESLIRLAEAHAKVRLSDKVEEFDVKEAKRLYCKALINAGERRLLADLAQIVKHYLKKRKLTEKKGLIKIHTLFNEIDKRINELIKRDEISALIDHIYELIDEIEENIEIVTHKEPEDEDIEALKYTLKQIKCGLENYLTRVDTILDEKLSYLNNDDDGHNEEEDYEEDDEVNINTIMNDPLAQLHRIINSLVVQGIISDPAQESITRNMFDDAIRALEEKQFLIETNHTIQTLTSDIIDMIDDAFFSDLRKWIEQVETVR